MGPFNESPPQTDSDSSCPRGCNYNFKIHESVFDHVADAHGV